ncbi:MAG: hypothetical protein C0501_12980 [Isosphaera sp.]|nr:hypothetical protein [Isosphaera sp.]
MDGFRDRPVWLLGLAGLVLAQAGLALALFGPDRAWAAVTDDRPLMSGRHPLHLYHGALGAESFCARAATTCYDPHFQAGYPKTPVFDGGSRPAELFLVLGGGTYRPGAYKVGLFAVLALVPVCFAAAARGAGLPAGAAVLAGAAGIVLGWSGPAARMIAEGQFDGLAAGLAAVVFVPWLARFAATLGVDAWLVLAAAALVGWYAHPFLWVGLTPVVLAYYLVFAPRHGPAFHLGLAGVTFAGVAPNVWWLVDWGKYWWVRQSAADAVPPPDWAAALADPLGGLPGGAALVLAGVAGGVVGWRAGRRAAAGLVLLAAGLAAAAARVAGAWPVVAPDVPDRLGLLAAAFLVPPAALAAWAVLGRVKLATAATVVLTAWLLAAGWADGRGRPLARAAGVAADPLPVGLTAEQRELVAVLRRHTTTEARVLWDETATPGDRRPGWNWSALLPVLTGRHYLGGLDPESGVEHGYCAMCCRQLGGRGWGEWTDPELRAFCDWYNVGWVVTRSPEAAGRWAAYPPAKEVARLAEGGREVVVFALDRPRSFVLTGAAAWESAGPGRVVLTRVAPNPAGYVELSLHWVDGLRVFPSYVRVEVLKDPTGRDPTHHVRLVVPGPTPRVTLTWDSP